VATRSAAGFAGAASPACSRPPQRDFDSRELLTLVGRTYHVFHVIVEKARTPARPAGYGTAGPSCSPAGDRPVDHTKLAEVIVSAIEVTRAATG